MSGFHTFLTIRKREFILYTQKMKQKRKRILDQIYNGAFEGATLTKSSKNALVNSGLLIVAALWIANNIKKQ